MVELYLVHANIGKRAFYAFEVFIHAKFAIAVGKAVCTMRLFGIAWLKYIFNMAIWAECLLRTHGEIFQLRELAFLLMSAVTKDKRIHPDASIAFIFL